MSDTKGEDAFKSAEAEFNAVMKQLEQDPNLASFKTEYEKLHQALVQSHDSEVRLMSKCRELSAELVAHAAKVESMIEEDDESAIAALNKEVEDAWKMVDISRENEMKYKDEIDNLKLTISELNSIIEQSGARDLDARNGPDVNELLQLKRELVQERDGLLDEVVKLRADLASISAAQQQAEATRLKNEGEIAELKEQVTAKKAEIDGENRKKAHLERDMKSTKKELELKTREIDSLQQQLNNIQKECASLNESVGDKEGAAERLTKELQALSLKNEKLEREVEQSMVANQHAFEQNAKLKQDIKAKEEDLNSLKQEIARLTKLNEGINRRLKASEDARVELEGKRDGLKSEASALERELEASRKQVDSHKKLLEDMTRTRDILSKKVMSADKESEQQDSLIKMYESTKQTLENEIGGYKEEAQKQRRLIFELEKERDKYINEASMASQRYLQALEDSKTIEGQNFDYQKRIQDIERRLKEQQGMYEQMRTERNSSNKSFVEAQDEVNELKRKLKVTSHQIEQLKEEISGRESSLAKEKANLEAVEAGKVKLKAELDKVRAQNAKHQQFIQAQAVEEEKLRKVVAEGEDEVNRQRLDLQRITAERDLLATQLVRRNDELALVYEKMKIQHAMLGKGEVQYKQRVDDIRLVKLEIKKLRREKAILTKSTSAIDGVKQELFRTQRELLQERARCKALESEVETPVNVHRWRRLEGSDPNMFEMVQKVQTLQKRLISKTEEVVEKEMLIQEKEKQYIELKNILARQPGPEVAEQVQIYAHTLKEKTAQLKAMASELNMHQTQIAEYKYEIERLNQDLQDMKKKYFEQKKQGLTKERERLTATQAAMLAQQPRFTGGGFNVSRTSKMATPSQTQTLS